MKIYIVLSRDVSSFVFCTTDEEKAKIIKDDQNLAEEMAGGNPSIYILETTLFN